MYSVRSPRVRAVACESRGRPRFHARPLLVPRRDRGVSWCASPPSSTARTFTPGSGRQSRQAWDWTSRALSAEQVVSRTWWLAHADLSDQVHRCPPGGRIGRGRGPQRPRRVPAGPLRRPSGRRCPSGGPQQPAGPFGRRSCPPGGPRQRHAARPRPLGPPRGHPGLEGRARSASPWPSRVQPVAIPLAWLRPLTCQYPPPVLTRRV